MIGPYLIVRTAHVSQAGLSGLKSLVGSLLVLGVSGMHDALGVSSSTHAMACLRAEARAADLAGAGRRATSPELK